MIEIYTGTPGSGKSLHAVERMKTWIEKFRLPVIANFEFRAKALKNRGYGSFFQIPNDKLCPDVLIRFSEEYRKLRNYEHVPEDEILLVVDEAQILWNSRSWQSKDRGDWISFFTQHRKLGYKVIMIAQYIDMLDKQMRSVIEYEHMHRKVSNIGMGGKIMSFIGGGNLHVDIKIYVPLNEQVGKEFYRADKRLCKLYDSYTSFTRS